MIPAYPVVAIDKTINPVYSKNPCMIGLIKTKLRGTHTGEAHITSKIVGDEPALNIGGYIVTRDEFNPFFIGKIINEMRRCRIKPCLVLLDCEFFADEMQAMSSAGITFLMPAVKNSMIKTAIENHIAGERNGISRYTIRSQKSLHSG